MPARKKSSSRRASAILTKDLFIFIVIMAVVAIATYILTYNAIMKKIDQKIGTISDTYQIPAAK